ncbi:putative hemolysin [Elusimicrobium posterum]|uniref:hemolysin family protein n=1 Tax=Elusimicrobium posterum TaxID=3116653 RepID=UPI003C769D45
MVIIVIILMLGINALLAAYEMALASISRTKLSIMAQENKPGAASALFMKDHIEGSLAVVQIGITLVGALAAAAGGASADEALSPILQDKFHISKRLADSLSVLVVVVPLSFFTIVFAELTPKTFAIKNKEFVVLTFSPLMRIAYKLLYPVVRIMEWIVSSLTKKQVSSGDDPLATKKAAMEDLRTAAAVASSSRLFGKTEEQIVLSSAFFSIRTIKEIQLPIDQVYVLYANDDISETFVKAHLDMHTRFPVCEVDGDKQSIVGYLNFKDIFMSTKTSPGTETTARSIMRPVLRLDANTIISTALQRMMKEHQHISLVVENNKITGIITLEDIFEEMVGEIEDEYDFFPAYVRKFGSGVVASAEAKMKNVFIELGVDAPANLDPDLTIEKWAELYLGREVNINDVISTDGIRVDPRKFRRKKIMEFTVTKKVYN